MKLLVSARQFVSPHRPLQCPRGDNLRSTSHRGPYRETDGAAALPPGTARHRVERVVGNWDGIAMSGAGPAAPRPVIG